VVEGEWRVTSKEKREDDSNASATLSGSLVLSVKDAGIGIAPDHLPRVFEMFSQVDSALSRSKGGLGIGLALVKGLVELHDGSVAAKSDGLGKGSEFIVRLPIAETVASDERRMTISEEMADPDLITNHLPLATHSVRKRVLVVDDNRLQAQSLATLLDMMGFEARSAFTGASALELVKHFTPDVALIDIGLPDIDGYQLARKLRGVPQLKAMTLIAQTGWGRDQDREAAKQAGFDHHLTKPINHQLLEALLLTGTDRESAVDGTLTVSS